VRLEACNISFRYNSAPVLRDLTLRVRPGEILSIVGPNGSGKSTLLKCVDGILQPQGGSVMVEGTDLATLTRSRIASLIGYVPQAQLGSLPATVFDTVLMGRKPYITWAPTERDLAVAAEVIDLLGLADLSLRGIDQLSGGQRQKVIVARALAQEPDLLLLDEPTSNLDLRHQLEVLDIVRERVEATGLSAVIAIHDLNLAARYSDSIVMMHNGAVFSAGGPEVLTEESIETVYGVRAAVIQRQGRVIIVPEKPVSQ